MLTVVALKIMLCSHAFAPSIGGIESVSELLARAFVRKGHEVKVVTQTRREDHRAHPYEIVRSPGFVTLRSLASWCDIFFQNNIGLQTAVALLGKWKPWLITHQTWIRQADGGMAWPDVLKKRLLRFAENIAISKAIADELAGPSTIIANPYDEAVFHAKNGTSKNGELIFVGRLVSDKGVDLLLQAVSNLKATGLKSALTLVGDGPESEALRVLGQKLQIDDQLRWTGSMRGADLADVLNGHRVMVVPSRWNEPFGIVALEGIACGCVVVGSSGGGLPEAIGPCGITVPNGDASALTAALQHVLTDHKLQGKLREKAIPHLQRHTSEAIGDAYLSLFQEALHRGGTTHA